jgi:hypothetical protein
VIRYPDVWGLWGILLPLRPRGSAPRPIVQIAQRAAASRPSPNSQADAGTGARACSLLRNQTSPIHHRLLTHAPD